MVIFNAFTSGLCCEAALYCFANGSIVFGIINLVLCLANSVSAVYQYTIIKRNFKELLKEKVRRR